MTDVQSAHPAVRTTYLECDQTSLRSVEAAAQKFLATAPQLDTLICNAGIMAKDAALTKDGYELHFGINHVAHALLIKMLLPALEKTAQQGGDARVVFLSSVGFRFTPPGGIVFDQLKTTQDMWFAGRWRRYGQSKLASVVYAAELARRHPKVTTASVHPGVIGETNLWNTELSLPNKLLLWAGTVGQAVPTSEGVKNTFWAATTARQNLSSGGYYEPIGKVGKPTTDSESPELRERLWNWTQKELEPFGE